MHCMVRFACVYWQSSREFWLQAAVATCLWNLLIHPLTRFIHLLIEFPHPVGFLGLWPHEISCGEYSGRSSTLLGLSLNVFCQLFLPLVLVGFLLSAMLSWPLPLGWRLLTHCLSALGLLQLLTNLLLSTKSSLYWASLMSFSAR